MANFNIDEYRVVIGRKTVTIGGTNYHRLALINCYGADPSTDDVKFTNISFIADEDGLPDNTTSPSGEQYIVNIYYPASCYAWCLDLLRNEGTTLLDYWVDHPDRNCLKSSKEPIGEGE